MNLTKYQSKAKECQIACKTTYLRSKYWLLFFAIITVGFCCSSGDEESTCDVGDLGSIPGSGRSPRERNGNPLQYSCLENLMDGGAWWATVHGVAKSRTRLSDFTFNLKICLFGCYSLLPAQTLWGHGPLFTCVPLTYKDTFMYWRRKWQPTPVFLPGESQGRGSLARCRL